MTDRVRRHYWRLVVLVGVAVPLLVFGPAPAAQAHTFLVRTVPAQGERLDSPPQEVSLEFTEPFATVGARLTLEVDGHTESLVAQGTQGGRVLRADLDSRRHGVYVVAWEVVAEDGHQSAGEFAFGVGAGTGDIPTARKASPTPEPLRVVMGWVFFVGLALAAGSLATDCARAAPFRLNSYRSGLVVAEVAALVAWADALVSDEPVRQRVLLATTAAGLAVALALGRLTRRWPTALALGVAASAWSARGHGAVANGVVGWVLDEIHLVAGAVWVGALVSLAVELRREGPDADKLSIARRYARLAAVLVVILAAAGVGSAFLLIDRLSDSWQTGYGQTLLVKAGLLVVALALAAAGRHALSRHRIARLRWTTPVEALALVGVLAAAAVLTKIAPPRSATPVAGASLLGPPPIAGPVVRDAGLAGNLTVSVTAGADQLRVEVFVPGGQPATDAHVEVDGELPDGAGITLVPRPCGPGCVTQRLALPDGTTRLDVTAHTKDWPEGTFRAELDSPPAASDPAALTDLVARIRAVPAVCFVEATTSGPGSVVTPQTFQLSGPDLVDLEPWAAGTADDIHPLPGQDGFRLYLPGEQIWVTIWLDDQGRIARERIATMSHEILHDNFQYPAG